MTKIDRSHYLYSNNDLKKLIFPLVLEQTLAITVGMADAMMISSAGDAAISGVSLVDMLNMLIFSVLSAVATGGAVIVGQNLGAKKLDDAKKAACQVIFTVFVLSTVFMLLAHIFKEQLLSLFFGKIEPDVRSAALTYLVISAFSFPFLGVYNACAALFRNMGKTSTTFTVSVIGNVINVIGNALCIFVFKMGVAGVAIPTLISRIVMAAILLTLLHNKKHEVCVSFKGFAVDFGVIKQILYIGIPGGIENGIFQLGRVLVMSIVSEFGTESTAAMGVANTLGGMGCIVGQAMNLAMIAVIGKCVGANDKEQIRYYLKKLLAITYISTAVINTLILVFLDYILMLYSGLGSEARSIAYVLVMIHDGLAIFLWPVSFVLPNMLRACNDVKFPMIVSIASMFIFRIGFSYILGIHFGMGAVGVHLAMIIDWICRIIFFTARYFSKRWEKTMYKFSDAKI